MSPPSVLTHPYDPDLKAEYGFDPHPSIQWFVEVSQGDEPVALYDASQSYFETDQPI